MELTKKTMDITFIRDFINKIISDTAIDRSHLDGNGFIYYCNGYNGTVFDYDAKSRTCEFCVYYNNDTVAIKCFVTQSNIEAYIFHEDKQYDKAHTHIISPLDNAFSLYELAQALLEAYDLKGRFNKRVTDWTIKYLGILD